MVFVTFVGQERSLRSSKNIRRAKSNLMPFGGGVHNGLSRREETRIGTSCGWQFTTQAACSIVRRAANGPSSLRSRLPDAYQQ
jgi:hypothetical protein